MKRLSRVLISLPLAALPLLSATPHLSASQAMRPADAVKLLAQSQEADAKCRHLAAVEHQELADYVARAEVAAARLVGVGPTQGAREAGARDGRAMACDDTSRQLVTATLEAARRADAQARSQSVTPKPARQAVRRTEVATIRQDGEAEAEALFPSTASEGLDGYVRHAAAYYVERRCRHLSGRDTMAFWKLVVARHYAMISRFGGGQVAEAKARAEAAGSAACDARSARLVRAAWSDIQRYR